MESLESFGNLLISLNRYQEQAASTAVYPKDVALAYTITGLGAEAGELLGKYAKMLRDDAGVMYEAKRAALIDELGDVLWFVSQVARELGVSLETVAQRNLRKLADRQGRGKLQGSGDNR